MKTSKELFDASRKLWGMGSQVNMLAEESTELALAALHFNRDNKEKSRALLNLAEEIADVEFMIEEFKYYFGEDFEQRIRVFRRQKQERLEILLNTSKPEVP
jgi:NTP pyrophosphatase (non-canonical NTP hydrolase)